jgi:Ca2+-binding EF-hand superfamily protein
MFDKNGDNRISPVELAEVMKYLGLNPTKSEIDKMIEVVDTNCNGYVDYDEFISMMTQTKIKPRSEEEELKEIFKVFDINGDGFINEYEIKAKMQDLGENLSDADVKKMIEAADINGDGLIDITGQFFYI